MSSYASMPLNELAEILGYDLAKAMQDAHRIALHEINEDMYPNGTVVRKRIARVEIAKPEPYREPSLVPPLDWVESQLIAERAIIGKYKSERAAMKPVKDADRLRTLEAVKRIKQLETIIRKHYSSATNGQNKL